MLQQFRTLSEFFLWHFDNLITKLVEVLSEVDHKNAIVLDNATTAGKTNISFAEKFCNSNDPDKCIRGPEQLYFRDLKKKAESFSMRFVDEDGETGEWFECYKNTPIAFDLDMSGQVEKITGEWLVDMDAD